MARIDNLTNFLTDVATAIKDKKGDTTPIPASNFDSEITNLPAGSSKYAPRFISFYYCSETELDEEIANLDTSNITDMTRTFSYCQRIVSLDLSKWNVSNVKKFFNMFENCYALKTLNLSNWNTTSLETISYMFTGCRALETVDLSHFNISKVTNMQGLCSGCSNLKSFSLANCDLSKTTNLSYSLANCTALTSVDFTNCNTSGVLNMTNMFQSCKLTVLQELDASSVNSIGGVLFNCTSLQDFGGFKNLGKGYSTTNSANTSAYKLDLSYCNSLTHDSLMNVINNLYDIKTKGCNAQQLVLGSTNLAKLTADEIAIATNKGWSLS